jgi:predicted amidohydrolase
MNKKLSIVGVQSKIYWEDIEANKVHFEDQIKRAVNSSTPDIIVLPETFTTGFTMNLDRIDDWESGETLAWMQGISAEVGAAIVGSVSFMFADGKARNRCLFVKPDGEWQYYDKRHLFSLGNENEFFEPGDGKTVVEFRGWKVMLQVCYDLRFPVFVRNHVEDPYDLIVYCANWPEPRIEAWTTLLRARAMENQAYVIGVSCVGVDGNGVYCPGESMCVDMKGDVVARNEGLLKMNCDRADLQRFRERFPVLIDSAKDYPSV